MLSAQKPVELPLWPNGAPCLLYTSRINVISVIPDTGFVPTIAMALAATVVNRKAIPCLLYTSELKAIMNKKYFLLTCLAAFPFALTAQENNRYEGFHIMEFPFPVKGQAEGSVLAVIDDGISLRDVGGRCV